MNQYVITLALLLAIAALPARSFSQAHGDSLAIQVETAKADLHSLERILAELNIVDSAYAPSFPRWELIEPNLKLRVYAAFRNRGKQFSRDDRIIVIVHPDSQTITDIRIGNVAYGKLFAQTLLARDLKTDLMAEARNNEPPYGIKSRVSEESNPLAHPTKPDWVSADISLFGASLRFGNEWGIEGRIGNDELGYPFWSSGNTWIMGRYKSIKLGAWVPINGGIDRPQGGTLVRTSTTRLLNGSDGIVGEFEFEWEPIRIASESFPYAAIGARFGFGGLSGRREEYLTSNLDSLYFISAVVQGYYAFDFLFDEKRQNLNVHLGATYHRVNLGKAVLVGGKHSIFKSGEPESFIDPYIRIEYRNYRYDRFRVTAQYSRLLMFIGWAEVVPPFIYAEVKFSTVVFRKPRAWEHQNYIYGTVGVKFDF
ncbi:MAG TPA: hypothetical protein VNL69_00760 [Bacteroidota bacterium]|nr:hypothetical protein [Bacteroidota bacterium]